MTTRERQEGTGTEDGRHERSWREQPACTNQFPRQHPPCAHVGAATCHLVGASAREGHCARPMAVKVPVRCAPRLGSRWGWGNTMHQRMECSSRLRVACAASYRDSEPRSRSTVGRAATPHGMSPGGRARRSPQRGEADARQARCCWQGESGRGALGGVVAVAVMPSSPGAPPVKRPFVPDCRARAGQIRTGGPGELQRLDDGRRTRSHWQASAVRTLIIERAQQTPHQQFSHGQSSRRPIVVDL